jgi:hypothetical protein
MMLAVRKLKAIGSAVLMAGLMILMVSCGSEARPLSSAETGPGPAARLAFTTQPTGGIAGLAFNTQPAVAVEDAEGKVVTDYGGLIAITITAGSGNSEAHLLGGTKTGMMNGTVEFKYLAIDKAGDGYTLTASCGNLIPATSAPFTILPGAPAKIEFTVQPSGGKAGIPLTPYPEVTVQDKYGNTVTSFEGSVSVRAAWSFKDTSDPYKSPVVRIFPVALSGTTTVRAVNGVARFSDISGQFARPDCTLTAVSDSLGSATSAFFSVLPGTPGKLEFTVQPSGGQAGIPFETQPKVAIEDLYGNVVTSSRGSITVSITPGSGTAGAILSGTNTLIAEDAMGGLAAFTDLSIDLAGSGYMLTVISGDLPSAKSQAFDVSAP